jgi:hypothetical protein
MGQGEVVLRPTKVQPSYHATAPANTAITITFTHPNNGRYVIEGVSWSYDANPTGGRLTVAGGGFDYAWSITTGGPGFIPLHRAKSEGGSDIVITLAAGGAAVIGDLNIHGILVT